MGITKLLLLLINLPMLIGVAIRKASETLDEKSVPIVNKVTRVNTIILCLIHLSLS